MNDTINRVIVPGTFDPITFGLFMVNFLKLILMILHKLMC